VAQPKSNADRLRLLARKTTQNRAEMIRTLLLARDKVQDRILKAARNKRYGTARRVRDGLLRDLIGLYLELQGDLDTWTKGAIENTSKDFFDLAIEDLLLTEADTAAINFTIFSKEHFEDYFERIHPFNADRLAAVNVHLNPNINRMLESDVRELQNATVEIFRLAEVSGLTPEERFLALRGRVEGMVDEQRSWSFVDKAGTSWKNGNYFQMLNRTVSAKVARDSYNDALIEEKRDLVQVIGGTSPNSHPACVRWNGKILSLTGATPGYSTVADAESEGLHHPNCCLPGTLVECPDIRGAFRVHYSGKAARVHFRSGKVATVTPNHMLLTSRGFVAAKNLRQTDNVISTGGIKGVRLGDPDINKGPSRIEDVFVALAKSGCMSTTHVPASAKDLHGDGALCNGNIDVVSPNGFLKANGAGDSIVNHSGKTSLSARDADLLPFSGYRSLATLLLGAGFATNRVECVTGNLPPAGGGHVSIADLERFRLSPDGYAASVEDSFDNTGGNPELLGEWVVSNPSLVVFDNPVTVEMFNFTGHVYDLHSVSTLYCIDGIVSSNCVHTEVYVSDKTADGRELIADKEARRPRDVELPKPKAKVGVGKDTTTIREQAKKEEE